MTPDNIHLTQFTCAGIHLKICPRGVTCCTPEMETKMWTLSRETYTSAIGAATQHMQATFHSKAQLFDGEIFPAT